MIVKACEPTKTIQGEYRLAKPNAMFPPWLTDLIRFYVADKGDRLTPCPICGSKKRGRWTMLCPFKAFSMGAFALKPEGEFLPLTHVCTEHMIAPTDKILAAIECKSPYIDPSGASFDSQTTNFEESAVSPGS